MSRVKTDEQCGPPPALAIELEGALRYCGDADPKLIKKDWKPRYCVLRKGHLAIYDKSTKPDDTIRPFAEVLLKDCIIGQTTLKENCFAIQSAGNTALFQAKDADERRAWLDELKTCLVDVPPTAAPSSNAFSASSRSTSDAGGSPPVRLTDSGGNIASPSAKPIPRPELSSSAGTPPGGATNSPPTFGGWKGGVQVLPPIPSRPSFLRSSGSSRGESTSGQQTPEKPRQQVPATGSGELAAVPAPASASTAPQLPPAPAAVKLRSTSPSPKAAVAAPLNVSAGRQPSPRPSVNGLSRSTSSMTTTTTTTVAKDASPAHLTPSNSFTNVTAPPSNSNSNSPSNSPSVARSPSLVPVVVVAPTADGVALLEALQQSAPTYSSTAQTLNELQQRIAALQAEALVGGDIPFLSNVHSELSQAMAALEGPLRTLYLLLPMPVQKEEKPKSLTAELDTDPEFKEMMERETPTSRPRNVTLRPLQNMLNEFDIASDEKEKEKEELTSPRKEGEVMSPRVDSKKEAEQLIAEMMSSNLMPGLAKARPSLKPSPSSPAVFNNNNSNAAKPVAKPVAAPLKPVSRPLPVMKAVAKPVPARPQVKDDLLDELEKEDLLTPQK